MSYEFLKRAIEARRSLTGVYDNYVRWFSPHVLGRSAIGQPTVVGFQYGGGRPDGMLPPEGAWCVFVIDRLHSLEPNDDRWVKGPLDSMPSALMSVIDLDSSGDERMRA
jgi:hypothetical protein